MHAACILPSAALAARPNLLPPVHPRPCLINLADCSGPLAADRPPHLLCLLIVLQLSIARCALRRCHLRCGAPLCDSATRQPFCNTSTSCSGPSTMSTAGRAGFQASAPQAPVLSCAAGGLHGWKSDPQPLCKSPNTARRAQAAQGGAAPCRRGHRPSAAPAHAGVRVSTLQLHAPGPTPTCAHAGPGEGCGAAAAAGGAQARRPGCGAARPGSGEPCTGRCRFGCCIVGTVPRSAELRTKITVRSNSPGQVQGGAGTGDQRRSSPASRRLRRRALQLCRVPARGG